MRTYIHINLCLSLMGAQLLFVVAIDKTGNKVSHSIYYGSYHNPGNHCSIVYSASH